MIEIVIGDVHAHADSLRALLRAAGALDANGRRKRGRWVVQVGDLLDRSATADENLTTARLAAGTVDVVLAGNHELQMLNESASTGGAALATLAAQGWPHAAFACGDWLVTHAGVHPALARDLPTMASECAAEINDRWHRRGPGEASDPLFDWRGPARGGDAPCGGIFWTHPVEWGASSQVPWSQVTGHVPQSEPCLLRGPRWAIDVGGRGRLAAIVRSSRRGRWRPVVVHVRGGAAGVVVPAGKRIAA
jgi:Calcineurin-like phosphoesterase